MKRKSIGNDTRAARRAQAATMGYFGGHVGKRPPAGALETKKCVDKLFALRQNIKGRGQAAQLWAASGRMVTDLEMNCACRGAVEVVNLCRNRRPNDVVFPECTRTFGSQTTDGRLWG